MNRANNKARIYFLAVVFLFFYSITCRAQNGFVNKTYTFSVGSAIKKTDIKIKEGDSVHITASGTMVVHGANGPVGAHGVNGYKNYRMDPVFAYGALLYKIGDDDWDIVNPEDTITSDRTGLLKFMVNDNDPTGNSGKFTVNVTVKSLKADNPQKTAKKVESKKTPENTTPHPTAGTLTLSELQKASSNDLNEVKTFLASKQFRFDDASKDNMNKYSFAKDNITASIVKDVKGNETTFTTSSADNYKAIKASLDKYGYKYRKPEKKVEGVTKYANSKYSLSIVQVTLNNKPQYFFTIKKR